MIRYQHWQKQASNGFGQPAEEQLRLHVKRKLSFSMTITHDLWGHWQLTMLVNHFNQNISDAPILAVTESYRRHPDTLKIEALVLTCIVRVRSTPFNLISFQSPQSTKLVCSFNALNFWYQAHPMASAKWTKDGKNLDASRRFLDILHKIKLKMRPIPLLLAHC